MKKQIALPTQSEIALQNLGKLIKTVRIRQGITATAMAELMDTTRVTLGSVEKGVSSVSIGNYIKALSILGLDLKLFDVLEEKLTGL